MDVFHPSEVGIFPEFWKEPGAAVANRGDRLLRHRLDADEPLLREHRLDHRVASRADSHRMPMRLDLLEQLLGLEIVYDAAAAGVARKASIGAGLFVHVAARVH